MTKTSDNIKYSPSLSIAENAKRNGVNEDAIRYYIRTRGVDRRYEEKKKVLKSMKDYLEEHPNATKAEVARQTGRGINTVVRYWDILQGKKKLQPNSHKANLQEQRAEAIKNRHIAYLDKLPVEFIREYLQARETASNAPKEVAAEVVEVAKQAPVEVVEAPKKTKAPKVAEEIEPKNWKDRIYYQINKIIKIQKTNEENSKEKFSEEDRAWSVVSDFVSKGEIKRAVGIAKKPLNEDMLKNENFSLWLDKAEKYSDFYDAISRISANSLAVMKVEFLNNVK